MASAPIVASGRTVQGPIRYPGISHDLLAPDPNDETRHGLTVTIGIAVRWLCRTETVQALTLRAGAAGGQLKWEGRDCRTDQLASELTSTRTPGPMVELSDTFCT